MNRVFRKRQKRQGSAKEVRQAGMTLIELVVYIILAAILGLVAGRILIDTYRDSAQNLQRNDALQMGDLFRRQANICRSVLQALLSNTSTAGLVDTANNRLFAPLTQSQANVVGAPGGSGITPLNAGGGIVHNGSYDVKFFVGGNPTGTPPTVLHFYPAWKRIGTGVVIKGNDFSTYGNHLDIFSNYLVGQSLFTSGTCVDSGGGVPPAAPPGTPPSGTPPSGTPPSGTPPSGSPPASPPSGSPPASPPSGSPPASPPSGSPPASPPASMPPSSGGGGCTLLSTRNGCAEYCQGLGRVMVSYATSCTTNSASTPNCNSGTTTYNCNIGSYRTPDAADCNASGSSCTCIGMTATADVPCSGDSYYYKDCNFSGSDGVGNMFFGSGGNWGWCFPKGTAIKTRSGTKPIEKLTKTDRVLSYDFKKNHVVENDVENLFVREAKDFVKITFADKRIIRVTPEHPFYSVVSNDWVKAKNLAPGDTVRTIESSEKLNEMKITAIETEEKSNGENVYNLEVNGDHNYFAEGVLVHNKTCAAEPVFFGACFTCWAPGGWTGVPAGPGRCTYQQIGLCAGVPCPASTIQCLPCNDYFWKFRDAAQNYCTGQSGQSLQTVNITCADTSKIVTGCAGPNNYTNCINTATRAGDIKDCTSFTVTCNLGASTTYTCP